MNKRLLSSITIAITLLALLPVTAFPRAHATTIASLAATPSATPGNPGDTFSISVMVDNVQSLVAYDVQLHYNGNGIHVTSVDFSGPFAATLSGCMLFPVVKSFNDAVGTVRSAVTTFSGCTTTVDDLTTGPVPVFVVNFLVVARQNSVLHITTDSECACSALAQLNTSGNVVAVPHASTDANFFAEPNVLFQKTFNVTSTPRQPKLAQGQTSTVLSAGVRLDRTESLSGFTFVVFDIITPTGKDITLTSNEVFLNPGDSATVSATFSFGTQTGTYEMFGTLFRGSAPIAIVSFETVTGQTFQVH